MERRDFLRGWAVVAGGALLGAAVPARAGEFRGYESVDPELFQGINRVQDPAAKTVLEKKHVPLIEVPAAIEAGEVFRAQIKVGEIVHPMSAGHYIQYVEVLAGNEPACRVELTPAFSAPVVTLTLRLDKPVTLVVREYCNLHGLWESRLDVSLKS